MLTVDRKVGCFPLLEAYMVPYSVMKASPLGGGFQFSSNSGPSSQKYIESSAIVTWLPPLGIIKDSSL